MNKQETIEALIAEYRADAAQAHGEPAAFDKEKRRREVRLCEFATSSREGTCGKEIFAWARYKRGDVPESGEFACIDGRVKAKFPNAELVYMKRRFVPVASPSEPTEVWWEYRWIVFKRKEGEKK